MDGLLVSLFTLKALIFLKVIIQVFIVSLKSNLSRSDAMFLDELIYNKVKAIADSSDEDHIIKALASAIFECFKRLVTDPYSGDEKFIAAAKRIDNAWNLAVRKLEKENIKIIKVNQFRQILEDGARTKGIKDKIWT